MVWGDIAAHLGSSTKHEEILTMLKVLRKFAGGFRLHYNYMKNHTSLKETPVERISADLNLGRNRVYDLMIKSVSAYCDRRVSSPTE
jgi:hypothetical protein